MAGQNFTQSAKVFQFLPNLQVAAPYCQPLPQAHVTGKSNQVRGMENKRTRTENPTSGIWKSVPDTGGHLRQFALRALQKGKAVEGRPRLIRSARTAIAVEEDVANGGITGAKAVS